MSVTVNIPQLPTISDADIENGIFAFMFMAGLCAACGAFALKNEYKWNHDTVLLFLLGIGFMLLSLFYANFRYGWIIFSYGALP